MDGRQIRGLFNQVIYKEEQQKNPKSRKLEKTIELAQANCEILFHENNELCEAVVLEKRKRKRQNPPKNYCGGVDTTPSMDTWTHLVHSLYSS